MIRFTSSLKSEIVEFDWCEWITSDKLVISSNSSSLNNYVSMSWLISSLKPEILEIDWFEWWIEWWIDSDVWISTSWIADNRNIVFISGLDSSSSMQCITLLRQIARSGRTVVATIHQPSSRLLQLFDHLYIVADGRCMYQGNVDGLVPFLNGVSLVCPSYHNPADYGTLLLSLFID